jgi:hypothetical protein
MNMQTSTSPAAPPPATRPGRLSFRTLLWIVALIALAFLLGWGPKELEKRRMTETLDETRLELRLATIHRQLGVASHEALRNNYTAAAVAAHRFFDDCRTVEQEFDLESRPRTRLALSAYGQQADTILGELSLGDPVVKERLASLYLTMNGVIERKQ